MNLETLMRNQNPQWTNPTYTPPEENWYHRPVFDKLIGSLDKKLVITITGLRRTGKSTLIKQILSLLLETIKPQNIFYFSFDGSVVKNESETLRDILEKYSSYIFNQPLTRITDKTYIFLDEVQIIPYWSDIIKTYYDTNPALQFVISGSSGLFISKKSKESLAGRVKEISVPPLTFMEYLSFHRQAKKDISQMGLDKYSRFYPEYLGNYFEKYLSFGQFPQPVKENYDETETKEYIRTIEEKIIEIDLPKNFPIKRPDILKIIFEYFKQSSGNLLSYENLTNDLGVDIRTTIKYIDWLKQAFLINTCLNWTKKMVKASRTNKKIYLASANFSDNLTLGSKVETYIYHFLKSLKLNVDFYRFKNIEIDFISTKANNIIPWEVKYQEKIKDSDLKNLISFASKHKSPYAFLITKNLEDRKEESPEKIGDTLLYRIPASKIELAKDSLIGKLKI